jgi:hypothetical protein
MTLEEMRKVGYFYALPEILAMITEGTITPGAAVANQGALTVTGADATAVATSATTAVTALVTKVNALLASLRTAGVIAA